MSNNQTTDIREDQLFADSFVINENNPFNNRKFVLDGQFSKSKRNSIKDRIKMLGGEYVSGDITKAIHYYLTSDSIKEEELAKYKKLVFDGYNIRRLLESDLDRIFEGNYEGYFVDEDIKKDLLLTFQHFEKKHVVYKDLAIEPSGRSYVPNPLYGKNVYLGKGITGEKIILSQMLGILGIYSGMGLGDSTHVIVLSEEAYLALQTGQPHEELTVIQDAYNNGLAQWYDYLLTTEMELLSWIKKRSEFAKDNVCLSLYNDFLQSKSFK